MAITDPVNWKRPDRLSDDVAMQLGLPAMFTNRWALNGIFISLFLLFAGILWVVVRAPTTDAVDLKAKLIMYGIFGPIELWFVWMWLVPMRVIVHAEGITRVSELGTRHTFKWSEIKDVRYEVDRPQGDIHSSPSIMIFLWLFTTRAHYVIGIATSGFVYDPSERADRRIAGRLDPMRLCIQGVLNYLEGLDPNTDRDFSPLGEIGI